LARLKEVILKINSVATICIVLLLLLGTMYQNIASIVLFVALGLYTLIGPLYLTAYKK